MLIRSWGHLVMVGILYIVAIPGLAATTITVSLLVLVWRRNICAGGGRGGNVSVAGSSFVAAAARRLSTTLLPRGFVHAGTHAH